MPKPGARHDLAVKEERARRTADKRAKDDSQDYWELFADYFQEEKSQIPLGKHDTVRTPGPKKGYKKRRHAGEASPIY